MAWLERWQEALVIVVQTFSRAGWPDNSTMELRDDAAAALFTAARDYEAEKHTSLHGDYLAAPVGGDRTLDEVVEMRAAWRAPRTSALWQTVGRGKYNMDPGSKAIPSLTSPHLRGECLDISDNRFLEWLIVNGKRYGLVRTLVAENDLRHFQFFPGTATVVLDVASLNNDSATAAKKKRISEDIMPNYLTRTTGPGNKPEFMLVAPWLPNGAVVTQDLTIANGWSGLSTDGGRQSDDEHWQATLNEAKKSRDELHAFLASVLSGGSGGTPADESGVVAAINALGVLIQGLPAEIDRYADGKKQSS